MFMTETGEELNLKRLSVRDRRTLEDIIETLDAADPTGRWSIVDLVDIYRAENAMLGRAPEDCTLQDGWDYIHQQGFWAENSACAHA